MLEYFWLNVFLKIGIQISVFQAISLLNISYIPEKHMFKILLKFL